MTIARPDETIGIRMVGRARRTFRTPRRGSVRVRSSAGDEIVSQVVDNDGDGTMDELIFQATFVPGEAKRFVVESGAPRIQPRRSVAPTPCTTMPRDDVAWESDRIAFRIYGQGLWKVDSLNSSGFDIWVKRVRDPIVDKWYAKGHDEYHHDNGEGADFFDVGESLGAGGTAIWRSDTLYRALNFKRMAHHRQRVRCARSSSCSTSRGTRRVSRCRRRSASRSTRGTTSTTSSSIFRADNASADIPWVDGHREAPERRRVGEQGEAVGVARRVGTDRSEERRARRPRHRRSCCRATRSSTGRRRTITTWRVSRAKSGEPVSYYIGAGWTDSGDFHDVRDWWTYLDEQAQRIATPLAVTIEARP